MAELPHRALNWAQDPVLDGLEVYRVGGAIRDERLGLTPNEHDFVVVGADPDQMLARGFRAVGRDFPVFLHPVHAAEFALARTERKSAPGYRGFQFHAGPDVTLEQDLLRRDLTINAIAEDRQGQLIDPFRGLRDIDDRTLRHVSPAFSEDPVRLLRLARFATRFQQFGVAEDTLNLCRDMVAQGEVDALVPERIWQEMQRALGHARPDRFFRLLRKTGALEKILPELDVLFGIPQNPEYHPEVDSGEHVMQVLNQAARLNVPVATRFACLVHDLGKGLTPEREWPSHRKHEHTGLPLVRAVSERLRVPKEYQQLALLVCAHHLKVHQALTLRASTVVDLIQALDGWRRPERFDQVLLACKADLLGRSDMPDDESCAAPFDSAALDYLSQARQRTEQVDVKAWTTAGIEGKALADRIRQHRIERVQALKQQFKPTR